MPSFTTPTSRWAALQSRDPLAANAFIYSVLTTKIYCRPNCPCRLARRANIIFHDNTSEAEADGFRPCKRCKPNTAEHNGDAQKASVMKACHLLQEYVVKGGTKWSIKALAKEVGLTECHFCRVFKKVSGVTVGQYRKGLEMGMRTSIITVNPAMEKTPDIPGPLELIGTPESLDLADFGFYTLGCVNDQLSQSEPQFAASLENYFEFIDFGTPIDD